MRHGSANRRQRNKNHQHNGGGQQHGARRGTYNRNQIFDSNGPDVRIRGTAHQVCEKYLALAKDASSVGDMILAESYLQHAEHYQRIINSWNEEFQNMPRPQQPMYATQETNDGEADLALPLSILGGDVTHKAAETVRAVAEASEDELEDA